jgi:hypothetical protein
MSLKQLAKKIQEDPKNYLDHMTDMELETDDKDLVSFLECFRDIPEKFIPYMIDVLTLIATNLNKETYHKIKTIGDLLAYYRGFNSHAMKGTIFELVDSETTFTIESVGIDFVVCHELGKDLQPYFFKFDQEIRYVF